MIRYGDIDSITVLLCQACQSMERAGAKKSTELERWWDSHKRVPSHVHPAPDEEITQENSLADAERLHKQYNVAAQASRVASAIKVGALGYNSKLTSRELKGVKAVVDSFVNSVEDMNRGL